MNSYNGTPRGLNNCNEGGCSHCNGASSANTSAECVCLHAEENALLEAGRERVGQNGVLYCNTCPCLKCTVKIVQTGVKAVVYNLAYKMWVSRHSLLDGETNDESGTMRPPFPSKKQASSYADTTLTRPSASQQQTMRPISLFDTLNLHWIYRTQDSLYTGFNIPSNLNHEA